jgi:hypothetical protein
MQWDQYEVWGLAGEKWEMLAWFHDFDVASAVVRNRTSRTRLIHAVYDDARRVQEDILAEIGSTREQP